MPYCQNSSPPVFHWSVTSQLHMRWKNENMKWNIHIKYLRSKPNTSYFMISSLKKVMSPYIIKAMNSACFHGHLRYGLTLWGGDTERKRIFQLQKKVIRIIGKADRHACCTNLLNDLNVLPLPCLYISEVVWCVKSNMENMKYNEEYMTIVQAKNHIFIFNSAELLFSKTAVQMRVKIVQ